MIDPDFAILITAANRCIADRLLAGVAIAGGDRMRPSFGFVLRAVAAEEPTVSRLAELLGVTTQAASRLMDDTTAAYSRPAGISRPSNSRQPTTVNRPPSPRPVTQPRRSPDTPGWFIAGWGAEPAFAYPRAARAALSSAVLRTWDLVAVSAAVAGLGAVAPVKLTFGGVRLFRRGRAWLLAGASVEFLTRKERVVDVVITTGVELHKHYRPGRRSPRTVQVGTS